MGRKDFWIATDLAATCCSDDETDHEDANGPKCCKVRRLQWRSSALEKIFVAIDAARGDKSSMKRSPGQPARIRKRSQNNPVSEIEAPSGLPEDCYDKDWLTADRRRTLKVAPAVLGPLLQIIDAGL